MSDAISSAGAEQQITSLIDRILRIRQEQDDLTEAVKDIYKEATSQGFNKTAMGVLVRELRKAAKDSAKAAEDEAILDLYRDAYHRGSSATRVGVRVREAAE